MTPPPGDTREVAEMALADMAFVTTAVGLEVSLDAQAAESGGLEVAALQMAAALADQPVVVINALAPEDSLRACQGNLLQSGPSLRMQMDAFSQYLRAMNRIRVLMPVGEDPADAGLMLGSIGLRVSVYTRRIEPSASTFCCGRTFCCIDRTTTTFISRGNTISYSLFSPSVPGVNRSATSSAAWSCSSSARKPATAPESMPKPVGRG